MSDETASAAFLRDLVANLPKGKQRKKLMIFLPLLAEIRAMNISGGKNAGMVCGNDAPTTGNPGGNRVN